VSFFSGVIILVSKSVRLVNIVFKWIKSIKTYLRHHLLVIRWIILTNRRHVQVLI